ncbi:MAG: leucyl aminopeptidase [Epulopiscium sp. Nuni2H_MBin001]|nr:MAG: leucyl aminopeptidase [Epulopiscium sp. Nuni2H_MBin001]
MKFYLDSTLQTAATIVPIFEGENIEDGFIKQIIDIDVFKAKFKDIYVYIDKDTLHQTILVGLGEEDKLDLNKYTEAIGKAARHAKSLKITKYGVHCKLYKDMTQAELVPVVVQGTVLATYQFEKYKSEKKEYDAEVAIIFDNEPQAELADILNETVNIVDGVIVARDFINEPANVLYPESFANRVAKLGQDIGLEVQVFDEKQIQDMGMEALWEVGKGSDKLPRLIVMRHMAAPDDSEILGVIGKGLTFDTGGYSLKPSDSMKDMKNDMGGAGAAVGLMYAIVKNNVKKNVIGVIAAAENAISGHSYKPGDIIGSMGGKTIEVINTDAEGRLTLIDAVTYSIEKENVTKIIDMATLTGAVLVALGDIATCVITNDDEFYHKLTEAAKYTDEKFWQLPAYEEYKELFKGKVADLANAGSKLAGSITAGMFIGEFVQGKPWMHLDIAGTAWSDRDVSELSIKGATGAPVRTLYNLIK